MLKVNQLIGFGRRLPSGGAAFSPDDVAGLHIWLKADAITGLSDNDPVATWSDSSGNANDATQASAPNRPIYKTGIVNSLPVVRFDGAADVLELGNLSALTEGEVFIVIKIDTDPPGSSAASGLWNLGTDTLDTHYPFTDGVIYDHFGTTARKTTVNPTPDLSSAFRIYNVWSAASDWASNLDGSSLHTTATNTVGFSSAARLGTDDGAAVSLDGDVAEFILYDNKISGGDRASVVSYLQDKYAL